MYKMHSKYNWNTDLNRFGNLLEQRFCGIRLDTIELIPDHDQHYKMYKKK